MDVKPEHLTLSQNMNYHACIPIVVQVSAMAVSLRIPEKTKRRVAKLARVHDTTAHAFMVTAIEDRLAAEEARAAFYAEAEKRAAEFKKTGKGIPAEEVFDYLRKRIQGKPAIRPKARKLI